MEISCSLHRCKPKLILDCNENKHLFEQKELEPGIQIQVAAWMVFHWDKGRPPFIVKVPSQVLS